MRESFTPGKPGRVRNIYGGALFRIEGYLGDGYHLVKLIPTQKELVLHENEMAVCTCDPGRFDQFKHEHGCPCCPERG